MKVRSVSKVKNVQVSSFGNIKDVAFKQNETTNIVQDEFVTNPNSKTEKLKKVGVLAGATAVAYGIYRLTKGKAVNNSSDLCMQSFNYIKTVAQDMSKALNKKIKPEQLSAVMTPQELLEALPRFTKENYFAYKQDILPNIGYSKVFQRGNLDNGIFKIDLHSHTNYSDGQANVATLLDDVVEYANKLHAKTNEKFIFSITDHDGIGGTKEALRLIAENPEKFKNLKFVTGVELSYAHLGKDNQITCSEILAHCINPYSPEFNAFIDKTLAGRKKLFGTVIDELNKANIGVKFDINEMEGNFFRLKDNHDWFKYNLHWRLYNYAQIKQRLTKLAEKWGKNPDKVFQDVMSQWNIWAGCRSPHSLEEFLKNTDLSGTTKFDKNVSTVCSKYFPRIENGKIVATSERTFDDIIGFFNNDKNVVLSFAHPAFTAQRVENPQTFFKSLIDKSNGLIKGTERHHMSYFLPIKRGSTTQEMVDNTNKMIDEFKLLNIGGHDNHGYKLLS